MRVGKRSEKRAADAATAELATTEEAREKVPRPKPKWLLVLAAMGYSKAPFRPEHVDITFRSQAGEVMVCGQGDGLPFDEARAKEILTQKEIVIAVDLHEGEDSAECWGCDLTYDYVKINGDYRT